MRYLAVHGELMILSLFVQNLMEENNERFIALWC